MKRSLPWLTHRWVEIKGRNLTCFYWDAALVLDASRHDERSPPSILTEATALTQRPSSSPERGQTAEGGGLRERESRAPPRFSQSHRRGSLVDDLRHLNVIPQSGIRTRKYFFLFIIYYMLLLYATNGFLWNFSENFDNGTRIDDWLMNRLNFSNITLDISHIIYRNELLGGALLQLNIRLEQDFFLSKQVLFQRYKMMMP